MAPKILCYSDSENDFGNAIGSLVCLLAFQMIYTIFCWIFMISENTLNSFFMFFMLFVGLVGMILVCRLNCVIEERDSNEQKVYFRKCLPIAALLMTMFSAFPLFTALFLGIGTLFTEFGKIIALIISAVFTFVWINVYLNSGAEIV